MKDKEHFFKLKATRTKHGMNMKTTSYGFNDIELIGVLERVKLAIHKNIMDKQFESIKREESNE